MLVMLADASVLWKEDGQQDPQLHVAAACQPGSKESYPRYARSLQSPWNLRELLLPPFYS